MNLSAEDLPLFGPDDLLRILLGRAPKETNFMDVNHADVFGSLISRTTHAVLDDSLFRRDSSIQPNHTSPFRRRYPDLFHPYHGEAWHILSRSFCSYITTSLDGFPRRLFAYYANYPTPDEGYFQTLLCASDLQETLAGDWLRFTDWSGHQEASGPTPITLGHVPSLAASGALFAHPIRDRAVAESIRGELRKSRVAMLEAAAGRVGRAPRGCGSVVLHREEALLQNLDVAYWH